MLWVAVWSVALFCVADWSVAAFGSVVVDWVEVAFGSVVLVELWLFEVELCAP